MKNLAFYLTLTVLGFVFQNCSVESKNPMKVPHSGWYEDPMNPKYAMKKYSEKPIANPKHPNLIK